MGIRGTKLNDGIVGTDDIVQRCLVQTSEKVMDSETGSQGPDTGPDPIIKSARTATQSSALSSLHGDGFSGKIWSVVSSGAASRGFNALSNPAVYCLRLVPWSTLGMFCFWDVLAH